MRSIQDADEQFLKGLMRWLDDEGKKATVATLIEYLHKEKRLAERFPQDKMVKIGMLAARESGGITVKYECADCEHEWKDSGLVDKCPKCGSNDVVDK